MKTIFTLIISITMFNACIQSNNIPGSARTNFKVWGNCNMCKETIEGSLKIDGISKVDWSPQTKEMIVSYDTAKISIDQIQKNITSVGYDTEKYKGDDIKYSKLPKCCQYKRKE